MPVLIPHCYLVTTRLRGKPMSIPGLGHYVTLGESSHVHSCCESPLWFRRLPTRTKIHEALDELSNHASWHNLDKMFESLIDASPEAGFDDVCAVSSR